VARKKTPNIETTDAEADFFGGEDIDWLTDEIPLGAEPEASKEESVEAVEQPEVPEVLEVAPPPVAAVEPVAEAADEPQDAAVAIVEVAEQPADEERVPNHLEQLVAQSPAPEPPAPEPPAAEPPAAESLAPQKTEAQEVAAPKPREPVQVPDFLIGIGGLFGVLQGGGAMAASITTSPHDREFWKEHSHFLIEEAQTAGTTQRLQMLAEAAAVRAVRLGDRAGALRLLSDLEQQPEWFSSICLAEGEPQRAVEALCKAAEAASGTHATELSRQAARLTCDLLGQPERGVALLKQALQEDETDMAAQCMLVEQLAMLGQFDEISAVLEQLAGACTGSMAAYFHWTRGKTLLLLEKREEARKAFESALQSDQGYQPAFGDLDKLLEVDGDKSARAACYEQHSEQYSGSDAAWWLARAAHLHQETGDEEVAGRLLCAAAGMGDIHARKQYRAWLEAQGRFDALAEQLELEATTRRNATATYYWFRLGQVREFQLGDEAGALEAYQKVLERDVDMEPAERAVVRLLAETQRYQELRSFLHKRVAETKRPRDRVRYLQRLIDLPQSDTKELEEAVDLAEQILAARPNHLPTLETLVRCLKRLQRWDQVVNLCSHLADVVQEPSRAVHYLCLAASICEHHKNDAQRALGFYRSALDLVPTAINALEPYVVLAETVGSFEDLAEVFKNAANASDSPQLRAEYFYRAAQVHAYYRNDFKNSMQCLERCIYEYPEYQPAQELMVEVAPRLDGERAHIDVLAGWGTRNPDRGRGQWQLLEAALLSKSVSSKDVTGLLDKLLEESVEHAGAFEAMEQELLNQEDLDGLSRLYGTITDTENPMFALRFSWLARSAVKEGQKKLAKRILSQAAQEVTGDVSIRGGLATLAAELGIKKTLVALNDENAQGEAALHLGRLFREQQDKKRARAHYSTALDGQTGLQAALELGSISEHDEALQRRIHRVLSDQGSSQVVQAAHGLVLASLLETDGDSQESGELYERVLQAFPESTAAFEGLRRLRVLNNDVEGLVELYRANEAASRMDFARSLEEMGEPVQALSVWGSVLKEDSENLVARVHRQKCLQVTENWSELYAELVVLSEQVKNQEWLAAIEQKKRELLSEQLAGTDEAWERYQELYVQSPDDQDVLCSLAKIATARNENALAMGFLDKLSTLEADPTAAVASHKKIAELALALDDMERARTAFLNALDYQPTDRDALAGLKTIATKTEDWSGLLDVLLRESTLLEGAERVALLKEMASVTEERLGDPSVAMDRWRSVLEAVPDDEEALRHLLALAEQTREWGSFVETGKSLLGIASAQERGGLLVRVGTILLDELQMEEGVGVLEEALTAQPPAMEAIGRLKSHYRFNERWRALIDALKLESENEESKAKAVKLLAEAAELADGRLSDPELAKQLHHAVLEQAPEAGASVRFLADAHFRLKQYQEARPLFEQLESIVEADADADDFDDRMELCSTYYSYGLVLLALEQTPEAKGRFEKALALNPNHQPSLEAVIPFFVNEKRWEQAEKALQNLLQLIGGRGVPERMVEVYTELGFVELAQGRHKKAEKRFQKALTFQSQAARAMLGLARCQEERGDWTEVMNLYNFIIENAASPEETIEACMNKGRVLDEHFERPDKAAQHYERALAEDARIPEAVLRLAELALRRADWPEAAGLAQRGLKIPALPKTVQGDLLLCLSVALAATGDKHKAEQTMKMAFEANRLLKTDLKGIKLHERDAMKAFLRSRVLVGSAV